MFRPEASTTEMLAALMRQGARLPGTPELDAFTDAVAAAWEAVGLGVHRDAVPLAPWGASSASLQVEGPDGTVREVPVASVVPHSPDTGPRGVSGPLGDAGRGRRRAVRGRVAVLDVEVRPFPVDLAVEPLATSPTDWRAPTSLLAPVVSAELLGRRLRRLARAGAVAVVLVWRGLPEDVVVDQWLPFTLPEIGLPAVWVAGEHADLLGDGRATLTVTTAPAGPPRGESVWCVVEGTASADETVLVTTHTDGPNPVEENGPVALVALARDLVANRPRRTHVLVAASGHLAMPQLPHHGQCTATWLEQNRAWWDGSAGHRTAVAGVVVEHVGARDDDGTPEIELVHTTTPELQALTATAFAARSVPHRAVLAAPRSLVHFGEGEPLHQRGVPAVASLAVPSRLLQRAAPGDEQWEARVDPALVEDQVAAYARVLRAIDATPADRLGHVHRHGPVARVRDALRLLRWVRSR
ncbi:hypothetical protein [Oerskovia flava]|uniref:hypothetical protein n=1 Tax=Oerskovia flava TaxID=2986422 RepID=UPI00223F39F6|nr:hypothetical protein [Oerskovia sp. JB1-3-2]